MIYWKFEGWYSDYYLRRKILLNYLQLDGIYHHFLFVRCRGLVQVLRINLRIHRTKRGVYVILSHFGLEQDVVYLMLCDKSCTHVRYIFQPNGNVLGKNREFVTAWRNLLKPWKKKVVTSQNRVFYKRVMWRKFWTWRVSYDRQESGNALYIMQRVTYIFSRILINFVVI